MIVGYEIPSALFDHPSQMEHMNILNMDCTRFLFYENEVAYFELVFYFNQLAFNEAKTTNKG